MNALWTFTPARARPLWPIWSEIIYVIYKVCDQDSWAEARRRGVYSGAPVDHQDGYIHFSTAGQLAETLARHFAGRQGLVLLGVPVVRLGDALQWEPSRGGDLFPHLYADLTVDAVVSEHPLALDAEGRHILPDDL
jgi:uncharacterized protein (DUF952 family)